jgi:hypothetical protein
MIFHCDASTYVYQSAGADFIFIPENPPEAHPWEEEMCEIIQRVSR